MDVEREKRLAAGAAAELVESGMTVGLGTGTTVAHFLAALAARRLGVRCVATSLETEQTALRLGLPVEPFDTLRMLDLTIDGADQVAPDGWVVKGGGGALTREKVAAAAAERFVVIVSSDKLVDALRPPVPLELLPFGIEATLAQLEPAIIRDAATASPNGGVIADFLGRVGDAAALSRRLDSNPGVIAHGLFSSELVDLVIVGRGDSVERIAPARGDD